jgi:hypothetical protein
MSAQATCRNFPISKREISAPRNIYDLVPTSKVGSGSNRMTVELQHLGHSGGGDLDGTLSWLVRARSGHLPFADFKFACDI